MKKKAGQQNIFKKVEDPNIINPQKIQAKEKIQFKASEKKAVKKFQVTPQKKEEAKIKKNAVNKVQKKIQIKKVQPVKNSKVSSVAKDNIPKSNLAPLKNPPVNKVEKKYSIKLIKPADQNKKVVAVILSFKYGESYDHLFTSVEQKAEQGTQVLVYSCSSNAATAIVQAFKKQSQDQILKKMLQHINSVDPDCVVFNWECCSNYGDKKFASEGKKCVFDLLQIIIQKGYMAMFSDFSLKALIAQWDQNVLGLKPFVQTSQTSGHIKLNFNSQKLRDCASAQLQVVGDIAVQGHCTIETLPSTIVYGIDMSKTETEIYKLDILTIVSSIKQQQKSKYAVELNGIKGMAGHVSLTYKSGAVLLTSMGHWIQLMKIDTSQNVLFQVAARQFGAQKASSMKMQYDALDVASKKAYISKNAVQLVKSSAPCKNMSKKAKKNF